MVDRRRLYPGVPYVIRPVRGNPRIVYRGKKYQRVYESKYTTSAYARALLERVRGGKGSTVWTGWPTREGRDYGVYGRKHARKQKS